MRAEEGRAFLLACSGIDLAAPLLEGTFGPTILSLGGVLGPRRDERNRRIRGKKDLPMTWVKYNDTLAVVLSIESAHPIDDTDALRKSLEYDVLGSIPGSINLDTERISFAIAKHRDMVCSNSLVMAPVCLLAIS